MKRWTKALLFLLCVSLILPLIVACASEAEPSASTAGNGNPTTDPTAAPPDPTEAPTTDPETPDETKPEKKGCKSTIGLTALLTVVGAAWVIRKKRED